MTSGCVAVMPAYNEAGAIGDVVRELQRCGLCCLVVDDGSTDETASVAQCSGAEVLRIERNCGVGFATRIGIEHARRTGFRYAVTVDADGQHLALDASALANAPSSAGLIVGCRFHAAQRGYIPETKLLSNQVACHVVNRIAGSTLNDVSCGLRRYDLDSEIGGSSDSYGWIFESLIMAARSGNALAEMPVTAIYGTDAQNGTPHGELLSFLDTCTDLCGRLGINWEVVRLLRNQVQARSQVSIHWKTDLDVVCVEASHSRGCYKLRRLDHPNENSLDLT